MFDWSRFTTSGSAMFMMILSTVVLYAVIILLTRLSGLHSFSKVSGIDFAVTITIGAIIAQILLSPNPPLLIGVVALTSLFALQYGVTRLRRSWKGALHAVDNNPLLLMVGSEIQEDNLTRARLTHEDLYAKLREANVLSLNEVRAVIMERTGDVSVLHGDRNGPPLQPELLLGVRHAERLADQRTDDP